MAPDFYFQAIVLQSGRQALVGSGKEVSDFVAGFCTLLQSENTLTCKNCTCFTRTCQNCMLNRHVRIACEQHAILACPCVFDLLNRSLNVQKSVKQIIYLVPLQKSQVQMLQLQETLFHDNIPLQKKITTGLEKCTNLIHQLKKQLMLQKIAGI